MSIRRSTALLALTWLSATASAQSSTDPLLYQGGSVLTSAEIAVVFWGSAVPARLQAEVPDLYKTIVQLRDFDWISEYDTPTQHIGRASFLGSYVISPSDQRTELLDVDIQAELVAQVDAGILPPSDENTYYAVYMPSGIKIREGFWLDESCMMWSGYHGDFGRTLPSTYAVFACCNTTCERKVSPLAVHELFEAVTDPHVNGWMTASGAEIADICEGPITDLPLPDGGALAIQRLWSNRLNTCEGSPYEFFVSLKVPTQPATGPDVIFEASVAGPGVQAGPISFAISGLPSGVRYTTAPGATSGSAQALTLHVAGQSSKFDFTVEARSDFWQAKTLGAVYFPPAPHEESTGCSQAGGRALPMAGTALLVILALGRRRG